MSFDESDYVSQTCRQVSPRTCELSLTHFCKTDLSCSRYHPLCRTDFPLITSFMLPHATVHLHTHFLSEPIKQVRHFGSLLVMILMRFDSRRPN